MKQKNEEQAAKQNKQKHNTDQNKKQSKTNPKKKRNKPKQNKPKQNKTKQNKTSQTATKQTQKSNTKQQKTTTKNIISIAIRMSVSSSTALADHAANTLMAAATRSVGAHDAARAFWYRTLDSPRPGWVGGQVWRVKP